jgi:hypothetical protein
MNARATTFIFLILVAGCATPQTEQEIANLDYGSCPTDYEEQITSRFQTGSAVAFEGAPILWPPQKYWTTEPWLPDGRLVAGYLVAVTADQIRGPALTAGRHVYGFLFKNGELISTIPPDRVYFHTAPHAGTREDVGPIPKDERQWKIVYARKYDVSKLIQLEPANDTSENTSERISHLVLENNTLMKGPPNRLMERDMDFDKEICASATQNVISQTRTEVFFERIITGCGQAKFDRYSIEKIVEGITTMTTVSYERKSRPTEAEREKWIKLVGDVKLTVTNECKQRQP